MEKSKKYKTELFTIAIVCAALIFILEKPARDYIPVIFSLLGFGRSAFLTWKKHYKLSRKLITYHKSLLTEKGIEFREGLGAKRVDFFSLITKRKKLSLSNKSIGNELEELNSLKNMTLISFLVFGILGIISVALT